MMPLVVTLLCLCVLKMGGFSASVTQATVQSDVLCHDWGVWSEASVRVYDGEVSWIYCPLFSHPTLYSYSQTQNSSLSLLWYRHTHTHDLEQPINLKLHTLHKDREYLWIQPATAQDAGLYICMLRNISSCVKIGVQLEVVQRDGECDAGARSHLNLTIPIQSDRTLTCPDLNTLTLPNSTHSVTWYHSCRSDPFRGDRELKGDDLVIHRMYVTYAGLYTCVVSYQMSGRTLQFTRHINVTAVVPDVGSKVPSILNPASDQIYTVTLGDQATLSCRVNLPHLYTEKQEIWWTIDNKTVEQLADPRFSSPEATLYSEYFGDVIKERVLHVLDFSSDDLQREFNCSARNSRGFDTSRAVLKSQLYVPTLELGCGLGVTLALMLMMFVVYHVFWLELLLLYRSWFGSDERYTDDKQYDVYISYARNSEEEEFVLSTLRRVLETEFGYSVCIFDRDSLPGGNLMESVLRCMQACRRLLVVLSSDCLCEKSVSLLECRLCLYLHHTSRAPIITVRRRTLSASCGDISELRNNSTCIRWHGARSEQSNSRFWKLLRLALPLRPLALGKRLIDSTSSHSDLASVATRYTQAQTVSLRHSGKGGRVGMRHLGVSGRGCNRNGRVCEMKGRGCSICVSFQESRQIWGGVIAAQWNTHLHQPVANGTIHHTTHNANTEPGNDPGNDLCPCEPVNNNQTNELQTTHC
ncbi:interleukin-1 receptor accessory protein isoform X1 [Pimephales promelas]|uniref:interleukin-1 receptor accessory protein isoform X1 n=1 Tax=Pimephales promelas TaxID=90988 RepID=UPI001955C8A9|nr:interleukin-1 receptor accessory protein isoform X1 [Pimephales promelas]XP_039516192.1 interleukin-1 receptor accessory protein isoform X1 [Pimephales promelas]XP_039516193.1 interleukin-1 receptor accessory protein isoform X1 [Pimephales promelas]